MGKSKIVIFIVLIWLLSSIKGVFAPDIFPESPRDDEKQTSKISDGPEIEDFEFYDDVNHITDTTWFSELPKVTNQHVPTTETSHTTEHSVDIDLYKTYTSSKGTSYLPLLKEDPPMEYILQSTTRDKRLRDRRKRTANAKPHYNEEIFCSEEPYWKTIPFFMAVSGWVLFFIVTGLNIHLKCRRSKTHKDDIETGKANEKHSSRRNADNNIVSMTHTELQQYHDLSDRKHIIKQVTSEAEYSDLSHGIVYAVNIIMDDGEKTKEHRRSTEKRAVIRRHSSSVLRSHSLLEDIQFARSVIMEENVDRQQKRKIVENRKLIQRRSSADIGRFSDDTLSYAVNVLSPSQHDKQRSKMASERRRVVREATSRERSGSFLDEVQFARSVVLPSHQIRELDEDAAFRRELVKESHCGAGRRMSFTDDVIAAQEIISPEWRVRAESFESDSRSLNEVEGKASGSWGSL